MDAAIRQIRFRISGLIPFLQGPNLRQAVGLLLLCGLGIPIAAGLIFTLLPAFGYLPSIGGHALGVQPWRELFGYPGFATSLRITVTTGVTATVLALILAFCFCAVVHGRMRDRGADGLLAPLLAAPHAAMAIGLAFLMAPSGWLARLASPWLTGYAVPPDIAIVQDPWGMALVIGLLIKELPFLLIVILAALNQIPVDQQMRAGSALGYGPGIVWIKIIAPQVYAQIRLPVYVVLAFSLSVVDMALILAPTNPAPLSVMALKWFMSPDVSRTLPAAAAATLELLVVVGAIGLWRVSERGVAGIGLWWTSRGGRGVTGEPGLKVAAALAMIVLMLGLGSLIALAVWSVAWRWPFPDALPSTWSLDIWNRQAHALIWPLGNTVALAAVTTAVALLLAVAWLEAEDRSGRRRRATPWHPIYIPLLLPQIAFLFGTQVLALKLQLDGTFLAVAWAHLLFVFPYVLLALADPWKALDPRYIRSAAALGASPTGALIRIKLPILLRPIAIAVAIGFSVSVAQYLPTLFAGSGRIATLTTEAVAMASGGDRRVVGVFAFLQTLIPFAAYLVALAVPRIVFANRRSLSGRS
ncbi:ABC transporter permease (plasmid) [Rhizobium sullae]|uniref:ABC transporter permease n=1 Tax=Rhizobium sullae TaxID=50338 RepID=A0ABY5XQM8_RHISU|nr:ABC transporter permease [Rhizobium sullae]UWU16923.1 ABC transporter permease [Rhizobium sullae]